MTFSDVHPAPGGSASAFVLLPPLMAAFILVNARAVTAGSVSTRHIWGGGREVGGTLASTRWIYVNKTDGANPRYRSRIGGREFNAGQHDAPLASTPTIEALRLIASHAAAVPNGSGSDTGLW